MSMHMAPLGIKLATSGTISKHLTNWAKSTALTLTLFAFISLSHLKLIPEKRMFPLESNPKASHTPIPCPAPIPSHTCDTACAWADIPYAFRDMVDDVLRLIACSTKFNTVVYLWDSDDRVHTPLWKHKKCHFFPEFCDFCFLFHRKWWLSYSMQEYYMQEYYVSFNLLALTVEMAEIRHFQFLQARK